MITYLSDRRNYAIVAIIIAAIAAALWFGLFNKSDAERVPEVKFVDGFSPQGTIQKHIDESQTVSFNIVNKESYKVSNISIKTTFSGDQTFFHVDDSKLSLPSELGAGGTTGSQTITITGKSTGIESGIIKDFKVELMVGSNVTDTRSFTIDLRK